MPNSETHVITVTLGDLLTRGDVATSTVKELSNEPLAFSAARVVTSMSTYGDEVVVFRIAIVSWNMNTTCKRWQQM